MALVLGTNCGFVTTAPTSDPDSGTRHTIDRRSTAIKDTSPVGATKIIEIGWWCRNETAEGNFEVGIYDHDSGNDKPDNLLTGESRTNAKGTTIGWKVVTGLNITISPETTYWIAVQLDAISGDTDTDLGVASSGREYTDDFNSTLADPWGVAGNLLTRTIAFYALVESPAGVTRKIKIAGTFQDKPIKTKVGGVFVDKPIKIKVGGTFQDA